MLLGGLLGAIPTRRGRRRRFMANANADRPGQWAGLVSTLVPAECRVWSSFGWWLVLRLESSLVTGWKQWKLVRWKACPGRAGAAGRARPAGGRPGETR